jgi:hypothetical protein
LDATTNQQNKQSELRNTLSSLLPPKLNRREPWDYYRELHKKRNQAVEQAVVAAGRIGRVAAFLSLDELQKFRQLIVDAKSALDAAK